MTVIIDGVNITPYIKMGGVGWSRYDVDGPNAGRNINGKAIRDRVATKIRLDVSCIPLELSKLRTVLNLIYPEYVTVTYDDPMYGRRTARMYSNNNPATHAFTRPDGTEIWDSISFPLVEE